MDELTALFDELGVGRMEQSPAVDDALVAAVERVIGAMNETLAAYRTLSSYIYSFVVTDSRDTTAQARQSEAQRQSVRLAQLRVRFTAWVGSLDVEAVITRSALASEHAFTLREARILAAHLMAPGEEALAAELNITGGVAWARLHATLTSQITVPVTLDGEAREIPMSVARNLAFHHDRATRRAGYEAELAAWERNAAPLAAALNSIKGQVNTLSQRRGWETPLDAALMDARIDHATLNAMMTAARESFPDWRRYLRAKARALGLERLAWYDLFAPVGGSGRPWAFDEGAEFIVKRFGAYSDTLSAFASRAFRERWIDAEPRPGKEDGAFCMWMWKDESRVMANFKPSFDGVSTIAHELGPRLSQSPAIGPPHAATRDADDAGRDRQHLLRDDHPARGAGGRPARRTDRDSGGGAAGPVSGDRGHHQPLPLRAARLRAAARARAFDRRVQRPHDAVAARDLR